MNTIQVQKTRWWTWAAAALLLGAVNIAQAALTWSTGPTPFTSATSSGTGNGKNVNVVASWGTVNTDAQAFEVDFGATNINGFTGKFATYCVDLATFTGSNSGEAGVATGTINDANSHSRNIGAAAYIINKYVSLANAEFLGDIFEKRAALQAAIWGVTYGATITGTNANVVNAATNIINNWILGGSQVSSAFFVDFVSSGTGPVAQDQIAAVPIPAALFFVAPALIGVFGGMRRKPQGMAA